MQETAAVIDVGSNSIKLLVAQRSPTGEFLVLESRALDTRISKGISKSRPELLEEGMRKGVEAIASLLHTASVFSPTLFEIVATSAVRDAINGMAFSSRVLASTGHPLRILTGDEEARFIGLGLTSDPALSQLRDFCLFDLGGGSLECLSFVNRIPTQEVSLPLGCVRLTEAFIADSAAPVSASDCEAISRHARSLFAESKFAFPTSNSPAVLAGGSMTTVRAILAGTTPLSQTNSVISVSSLNSLSEKVCALPLPERLLALPGLPAARADVFPAALITMLVVAGLGGFDSFYHSFHNLRYGLAAALLENKTSG